MHLSTCMHPKIKYEEEWINFFKMCLYTSTCTQKSNMMKNGKWINFSKRRFDSFYNLFLNVKAYYHIKMIAKQNIWISLLLLLPNYESTIGKQYFN